tara:strand:- start:53882 stop:55057 length:1176 start_codon:yes stop_codon:yes gene_type:complete
LYFSVLDNKKDCFGFYQDGKLYYDNQPDEMKVTWKHSETLSTGLYEYISVLARADTIKEVCPLELKEDFDKVDIKLRAFYKSFITSQVSLEENCFFDLVPQQFLLDYYSVREQIMKHIYENTPKTENYDYDCRLHEMLQEMSRNPIKLDHEFINKHYYKKKLRDMRTKNKVQYKQFSGVTGRLSVTPSSFPIMTLDKELRKVVLPENDWILEIDYNAAELRVFLGLSGHDQPQGDLHRWNSTFLKTDRQHAKRSVIAYMYGSKNYDVGELEKLYNVRSVKREHFDPEKEEVVNLYGRKIKSDEFHAVNYTIQSTAAEIALRNTLKIHHLLKDRKSSVKFCLHDSVVIDFSDEDRDLIYEIRDTFSKTPLGIFPCKIGAGKNFGDIRELKIG